MKLRLFYITFFFFFSVKSQVSIEFVVKDTLQSPISDAYILINSKGIVTNSKGIAKFSIKKGNYNVNIQHLIYKSYQKYLDFSENTTYNITLQENTESLQEVVITAKENEGITATSIIDKKAMLHLQPSSFADLMSLLPGKTISNPVLNYSNNLSIREVGHAGYSNTLGTAFMIDGVPINTNSNLQKTVGISIALTPGSYGSDVKRNSIRRGVDMRAISTDGIEKVEIVRGIPSVKYGDLSNGLVKIQRKKGFTKWNSRMKSDGFSKLFYAGKGFYFDKPNISLNVGLDYLNAKPDPRNDLENYKRYTASVRTSKVFEGESPITWNMNLDYTGTVDEEKFDPDTGVKRYDSYKSTYNNIRLSNKLNINFSEGLLRNIDFKTNISQSYDKIKQRIFVQNSTAQGVATSLVGGEYYGIYIDPSYVSDLLVDGKPLDIYADLSGSFQFKIAGIKNKILLGSNYTYSKNNGLGQVYDREHPPIEGMRIRPRAFKDIPSMQNLAFYIEDIISCKLAKTKFTLQTGLRGNTFVGLNSAYEMSKKMHVDPRMNFKIDFPKITFKNDKNLLVNISAGYGRHHKLPILSMLYPQKRFVDSEQLNYYHSNKDYRQVHYKTTIIPFENYNLKPSLNLKKELRLGFSYDYHSLYTTFFKEQTTSLFSQVTGFKVLSYKKYDISNLNHTTVTTAPLVKDLPFSEVSFLQSNGKDGNSAGIDKKGIEFQYQGKRFKKINTRFTLNGAWLETKYYNSEPVYKSLRRSMINGKFHREMALYGDYEIDFRESLKIVLITDTYLPLLGLTASFRFDANWYHLKGSTPVSGVPTHYVDENGKQHEYTKVEMNDPVLKGFVINYRKGSFKTIRTPFAMHGHLKISKKFYNYFTMSMYVNDLFNYYESQEVNGVVINRKGLSNPYFGMELNINF